MSRGHSTCWTVVQGAAAGRPEDRSFFAQRYDSLVRAFLRKRWRGSPLIEQVDDAGQEIFLEIFRQGGALERFDADRAKSFRSFLYAIIRNVARRIEERYVKQQRQQPAGSGLDQLEQDEATLSQTFDRLWAKSLVREATRLYRERSDPENEAARRRVEVLELRFGDGMPIRDIARKWGVDAARVHKDYAKARQEFKAILVEVLSFHNPGSPESAERDLDALAALLA